MLQCFPITGSAGGIGATGSKGDKGTVGSVGVKGDKGETGVMGVQGRKGEAGNDGTVGELVLHVLLSKGLRLHQVCKLQENYYLVVAFVIVVLV